MKDFKKVVLILVVGGTVAYLSVISPLSAQPPTNGEPKDKITLDAYKVKKPAVTFDHKKHSTDFKCKECHHKPAADGNKNPPCGSCHKTEKVEKTPSIKEAFHKNCVDCHKAKVKADPSLKEKVPTTCVKCHK